MPLTLATFDGTRDAALALRAAHAAHYLGGGTLLVRRANEGDLSIETFVRATDPALSAITLATGQVTIGASIIMAEIAAHPDLGALSHAAKTIGGPAVRNMATVGGNLFAPAPYGDFGVALLALDAQVSIESADGREQIALATFFARREQLSQGSIVTAVTFSQAAVANLRFHKVSRVKPKGAAVLSIAAVLVEEGGRIASAAIALGGMAKTPIRARAAEAALIGRPLTREGIAPALAAASVETSPATDGLASAWYRREVLPVHLGRLLIG